MNDEVENIWKTVWEGILLDENGVLHLDQVKKEMFDYYNLIENSSKVTCAVTGGLLSYANYPAETIISIFEDRFLDKSFARDDIFEIVKDQLDEETLDELNLYLF